ncbi:MAG TPA: response regulator [Kofleriaceae bacterium]|nr:response regulator [Kofleriaceae bacterium]
MPDPASRVLVVDDDFATRLLASEALLADGFTPVEAADGREALEQYDRSQPDAVLLDVHMPVLDGYEVCRRIRKRPGGIATSILVMTASDDVDAVQRAFAAGATDFLTKPLNLPLLAHRVRYMLRAAEAASAACAAATKLARAQRLARLVHWELGTDNQFLWAGDPLEVFWPDAPAGYRLGPHLLTIVHPDDRARVSAVLAARASHQLDYRMQFPDGSERIVHQDAEVDFTDRGVVLIGATQDITGAKQAEQQIAQLAFYDDLTGIPNRQFVARYLRHADPRPPRTAIAIDLGSGHLDRLSTAARDALIRAATARVIERVRGADLEVRLDQVPRPVEAFAGATLVARTAPDELLVLTADPAAGPAATVARRIADVLAQPFPVAGRDLALRPRFGAVDYPDPAGELRQLDELAREMMYEAERSAPRDIVAYSASARERRTRRRELAYQLALALDASEAEPQPALGVDYVPRVELAEGGACRVIGVRAGPRWVPAARDPTILEHALAGDPLLRDRLASWTLHEACRDAARWQRQARELRIAVELPCGQLRTPGFAEAFERRLAETGADPRLLDLEITDLPADPEELDRVAAALRALRALGIRIALAEVGDGCSIGELRRLPLDALRIDRAAIDRLGPTFLAAIATIAQALALALAVAGIDSPAALAALDPHTPHELSGALFGAAVPASGVPGLAGSASAPAPGSAGAAAALAP